MSKFRRLTDEIVQNYDFRMPIKLMTSGFFWLDSLSLIILLYFEIYFHEILLKLLKALNSKFYYNNQGSVKNSINIITNSKSLKFC